MNQPEIKSAECRHCGSKNNPFADACWVCYQPLNEDAVAYAQPVVAQRNSTLKVLKTVILAFALAGAFVAAGVIVLFFVCVAILSA